MSKHHNKHAVNSLSEEDRDRSRALEPQVDEDVEEPEDPGIPASETVNITTEELASAPLDAVESEPLVATVERPTNITLNTLLYFYDVTKRHPHNFQKTIQIYQTRQLVATVKDDVGQDITGFTIPEATRVNGLKIEGMINLELKPIHKVKKLLGFDDVVVAETKQQLNDSVATDKE